MLLGKTFAFVALSLSAGTVNQIAICAVVLGVNGMARACRMGLAGLLSLEEGLALFASSGYAHLVLGKHLSGRLG